MRNAWTKISRRALLLGICAPALAQDAPTDPDRLNKFAEQYNQYAHKMNAGIVDIKLWGKVKDAWRSITRP